MKSPQPNDNGVLSDEIIILQHKDDNIEYNVRKSHFNNEEYFACSVLVKGFGIYSGFSGPVSICCKGTKEMEIDFIKKFLTRHLANSENGLKYLNKLELFQKTKQLSLFE